MSKYRWTPHVTVATVVEKNGRYLLVHEAPQGVPVYNQPAGHLDENESLIAAAARETLEETGWQVDISDYLGVYRYQAPNGVTYLRHGFVGQPRLYNPEQSLDTGIIEAVWMDYQQVLDNETAMRSPMVKQLIDDYRKGIRYPLAALNEENSAQI